MLLKVILAMAIIVNITSMLIAQGIVGVSRKLKKKNFCIYKFLLFGRKNAHSSIVVDEITATWFE